MKFLVFFITTLACILRFGHALQCYVGIGNASDPLHNDGDLSLGSGPNPNQDEGFFMRECGERGSQLVSIEAVMQNITERIKESWGDLADKATKWAGSLVGGSSSRRKRLADLLRRYRRDLNETESEDSADDEETIEAEVAAAEIEAKSEDENYACVKAMAAGVVYRSCVPKYGIIRLNCTSAFEQNVLCYCHTEGCNGSDPTQRSIIGFVISATLLATIFR